MFEEAAKSLMVHVVPLFFHKGPVSGAGTGTIIDQDGLILTANHVVPEEAGFKLISGRNYLGTPPVMLPTPFQVVSRFPEYDLALMKCPSLPLDGIKRPVEFLFDRLSYGRPLGSFGYPQPLRKTQHGIRRGQTANVVISVTMGLRFKSYYIAGLGRLDSKIVGARMHEDAWYQLDSFAYGGHSGGPVFDQAGRILAVMSSTYLHTKGQYELSYCTASGVENIAGELTQ